jgi:hypothetical protein
MKKENRGLESSLSKKLWFLLVNFPLNVCRIRISSLRSENPPRTLQHPRYLWTIFGKNPSSPHAAYLECNHINVVPVLQAYSISLCSLKSLTVKRSENATLEFDRPSIRNLESS